MGLSRRRAALPNPIAGGHRAKRPRQSAVDSHHRLADVFGSTRGNGTGGPTSGVVHLLGRRVAIMRTPRREAHTSLRRFADATILCIACNTCGQRSASLAAGWMRAHAAPRVRSRVRRQEQRRWRRWHLRRGVPAHQVWAHARRAAALAICRRATSQLHHHAERGRKCGRKVSAGLPAPIRCGHTERGGTLGWRRWSTRAAAVPRAPRPRRSHRSTRYAVVRRRAVRAADATQRRALAIHLSRASAPTHALPLPHRASGLSDGPTCCRPTRPTACRPYTPAPSASPSGSIGSALWEPRGSTTT